MRHIRIDDAGAFAPQTRREMVFVARQARRDITGLVHDVAGPEVSVAIGHLLRLVGQELVLLLEMLLGEDSTPAS